MNIEELLHKIKQVEEEKQNILNENDKLHLFALKKHKGNVTFHSFTPTLWAF
uniref:Uncharacterized protein n=1 Tax=viral metagenome TaxID=1070528 RepID=A0A6C0H2G8_9ZZZZ